MLNTIKDSWNINIASYWVSRESSFAAKYPGYFLLVRTVTLLTLLTFAVFSLIQNPRRSKSVTATPRFNRRKSTPERLIKKQKMVILEMTWMETTAMTSTKSRRYLRWFYLVKRPASEVMI